MQIGMKNLAGEDVGEIELSDVIFAAPVRADLLHRVVRWQLAKRRAGTHSTLGRSDVRGTRAKMFKQKGTGRARHGSKQANLFRGGGIVFGPKPRDHGFSLPKSTRKQGMRAALSSKVQDGDLIVIDDATLDAPRTKVLVGYLKELGIDSALVITGEELDRNFKLASQNLTLVDVLPSVGANVFDIMRRRKLVVTQEAIKQLEARLA